MAILHNNNKINLFRTEYLVSDVKVHCSVLINAWEKDRNALIRLVETMHDLIRHDLIESHRIALKKPNAEGKTLQNIVVHQKCYLFLPNLNVATHLAHNLQPLPTLLLNCSYT